MDISSFKITVEDATTSVAGDKVALSEDGVLIDSELMEATFYCVPVEKVDSISDSEALLLSLKIEAIDCGDTELYDWLAAVEARVRFE